MMTWRFNWDFFSSFYPFTFIFMFFFLVLRGFSLKLFIKCENVVEKKNFGPFMGKEKNILGNFENIGENFQEKLGKWVKKSGNK